MDWPVVVLAYCAGTALVLVFLLTAFRGARRVDDQHDRELLDALERKRDSLRDQHEPLPPLRARGIEEPLPKLREQAAESASPEGG